MFIKNNIYFIVGALCLIVICVLYFTQDVNNAPENNEPKAEVIYSHARDADSEPALPEASTEPAPTQATDNITVYITGEVVTPGVYSVPHGARVWQVLEQAGGFTEQAAEDYINLAAFAADTQHIVVPAEGDPSLEGITPGTEPSGVNSSGVDSSEPVPSSNGLININTADAPLLQTLPGIGEQIAQYIIEYREQNGGFGSVDEILNVDRIGAVTFGRIKDRITV